MTVVYTALFIDIEGVKIGEVISVRFFTEWTVFEPKYVWPGIVELDLVLGKKMLDGDSRAIELGLIDEVSQIVKLEQSTWFTL